MFYDAKKFSIFFMLSKIFDACEIIDFREIENVNMQKTKLFAARKSKISECKNRRSIAIAML